MKPAVAHTYEAETRGVVVRVRPAWLEAQSDPAEGRWVWAYAVEVENRGERPVRLVARRWIITDALGRTEEVRGPGVVGEQPLIEPGRVHRYVSSCPLPTPSGMMVGSYQMLTESGDAFEAEIPAFSLHTPEARRVLN